jgi:hypothetical protein
MCAVMLPDGRWTHVPRRADFDTPPLAATQSAAMRSGRVETASPSEHPDDRRAVALLVAHDLHDEALLLEQ